MGQDAADASWGDDLDAEAGHQPRGSVWHAIGLTAASAVVWGIAHLAAGRRLAGFILMGLLAILLGGLIVVVLDFRERPQAGRGGRDWLVGITIGILVLALLWAAIVVRSYQVVRPRGLAGAPRVLAAGMVMVLVLAVCTPLAFAARDTYTLRDTIGTIFHGDAARPPVVNVDDPWQDKPRVNILLLGGDGAGDRVGVRTDSMTVASIDTHTGEHRADQPAAEPAELPRDPQAALAVAVRLHRRGRPGDEGLLNELFQDAEDDKSMVPGFDKGRRGPELVREEISYLIGQPIDYYILVNLFGFADIIDAMGGVKVHIPQDIPYGGPEDGSAPDRRAQGRRPEAERQTGALVRAFAHVEQRLRPDGPAEVPDAGRRPAGRPAEGADCSSRSSPRPRRRRSPRTSRRRLLPALVRLSGTMKHGAQVNSLMFVPPQFHVVRPNAGGDAAGDGQGDRRELGDPTAGVLGQPEAPRGPEREQPTPAPTRAASRRPEHDVR